METWKTNLEETKKRYIDWWNHKGIILNMWEHFQEGSEAPRGYPSTRSGKRPESEMVRPTMACRISGLVRSAQQPESRYPAGCQYPVRPRFTGSYFRRRIRRRRRYNLDSS